MKRLVVVADNPLIVGAIRTGLRDSGAFQLLGYVDPRKTTARGSLRPGPRSSSWTRGATRKPRSRLIQSLREQDEDIKIIVLALRMEGEWLERAFAAGANGAMSKAIHPAALATLIRETVAGHIVHSPARFRSTSRGPVAVATEHSTLTERETEILRFVASGDNQRRDRAAALDHAADGEVSRLERVPQARRGQPHRGVPLRARQRSRCADGAARAGGDERPGSGDRVLAFVRRPVSRAAGPRLRAPQRLRVLGGPFLGMRLLGLIVIEDGARSRISGRRVCGHALERIAKGRSSSMCSRPGARRGKRSWWYRRAPSEPVREADRV